MDFCKQFNDESQKKIKAKFKVTVTLSISEKDKSFKMSISAPPVADQIIAIIGRGGSGEPNKTKVVSYLK